MYGCLPFFFAFCDSFPKRPVQVEMISVVVIGRYYYRHSSSWFANYMYELLSYPPCKLDIELRAQSIMMWLSSIRRENDLNLNICLLTSCLSYIMLGPLLFCFFPGSFVGSGFDCSGTQTKLDFSRLHYYLKRPC